jgi:hypothetical protein
MNRSSVFPAVALLAFGFFWPVREVRAADDAGALMAELSQQVRRHGEKLARCVDNTATRHAQNTTSSVETAAAASVEDCAGVLRVFIAACSQNIQPLCENFAKEMRAREEKRAVELIARLRRENK